MNGVSGANEDAVAFTPTALGSTTTGTFGPGLALDGSVFGLAAFNVDGIHFVPAGGAAQAARRSVAGGIARNSGTNLASAVATSPTTTSQRAARVIQPARWTWVSSSAAMNAELLAVTSSSIKKNGSSESSNSLATADPTTMDLAIGDYAVDRPGRNIGPSLRS